MTLDARTRSLLRLSVALSRTRKPPSGSRPDHKRPDAGAVPVEPPRTPTLSGGAAAVLPDE